MMLVCSVCRQHYEADTEGTADEVTPVCVGCITTLFHGTALTPTLSIQPITLQEFRKRMQYQKTHKVKKLPKLTMKGRKREVN